MLRCVMHCCLPFVAILGVFDGVRKFQEKRGHHLTSFIPLRQKYQPSHVVSHLSDEPNSSSVAGGHCGPVSAPISAEGSLKLKWAGLETTVEFLL